MRPEIHPPLPRRVDGVPAAHRPGPRHGLVLVRAADPISLGTATDFAVLAGTTITNTGSTTIDGDVGLSPGIAVTGFTRPHRDVDRQLHPADAVALQAQADLATAYDDAVGSGPATTIATELGGTGPDPGRLPFRGRHLRDRRHRHTRRFGSRRSRLHLPDGYHAQHRRGQRGGTHQWGKCLQRLLAGRQLRDSRSRHGVPGQHPCADGHHSRSWNGDRRPDPGPGWRRHPGHEHHHSRDLCG